MRSPSTVPGATRFTVANAALPANGRPRVWAATAVGTLKFAARFAPGMLCIVPLTCTPIFGTMYDANPLNCVRNGGTTLQYGLSVADSGSCARISQVFVVKRPVLVPP